MESDQAFARGRRLSAAAIGYATGASDARLITSFPWKVPADHQMHWFYEQDEGDIDEVHESKMDKFVKVMIPPGFPQAGRQIEVVIPKGTKAGEVLDIPIPPPEENETAEGGKDSGVGIVFAPGPDSGLYVKTIIQHGPTWRANEEAAALAKRSPTLGVGGGVRVGDCLLDVQDVHVDGKKGKKIDVFAKPVNAVVPLLLGYEGTTVELSFRRVTKSGDAVYVTVPILRGQKATPADVRAGRSQMDKVKHARFKELDEDGSGTLTLNEVFQYLLKNPIPGSKSVWETTVLLFSRADRDGSGTIDMDEFESSFDELIAHFKEEGEFEVMEDNLEHRFETSLQKVENNLISTIGEFSKRDFMRLMCWVKDPEDTMLMYSMYTLVDWNFESARAVLRLSMLHKNPDKFWQLFCRTQVVLKQARLVVVHAESSDDHQTVDMEISEARQRVAELNKEPSKLTGEMLKEELALNPMIRNLTSRQPGRGIPTRQWSKYDHKSFIERQKQTEMPKPFWGRSDEVSSCIEALKSHRLTTIVGGAGCGKSTVAQAVIATLQDRAKQNNGVYMYRDGICFVDCVPITSYERLCFMIGQTIGLIVTSAKEFGHHIRDSQMLIVLDGVHTLFDAGVELMQTLVYELLDLAQGTTFLLTSRKPLAVPYENVMGLPPLDDNSLSKIIRMHCSHQSVYSGDMIVYWLYGNPVAARCAAALLSVSSSTGKGLVHPKELVELMELSRDRDKRALQTEQDPWVDNRGGGKLYLPDGKLYGEALCMRAWVHTALSHLQVGHPRAYDFVRLLRMVPSGLFYLEVESMVHQSEIVLTLLVDTYGFVQAVDRKGVSFPSFYEAHKSQDAHYFLKDFVARRIDESDVPLPAVSRVMLKLYLPVIDNQIDDINRLLNSSKTSKALKRLRRRENTLWACSNFEMIGRNDLFGDDIDALEAAGKLALFGSMIMMSLQRLPEALLSAVNSARLFGKVFDIELTTPQIKERRINPLCKVRGPAALGQALRLTAEIKLEMGAIKSAKSDLELSFKLQKRIKESVIAVYYIGSRLGQADVLWSWGEACLTMGDFDLAKQLINSSMVIYEDLSSRIGQGMALVLLAYIGSAEGDIVYAFKCINEAIVIFRQYDLPGRLADSLLLRAEISVSASNLARAREDLEEAQRIAEKDHGLLVMGQVYKQQGEACMLLGSTPDALEKFNKVTSIGVRTGNFYLIGEGERLSGEAKMTIVNLGEMEPRYSEAREHLRTAMVAHEEISYKMGLGNTHRAFGHLYAKMGHHKHAEKALLEALDKFQTIGHSLGVAVIKAALGNMQLKKGKSGQAGYRMLEQTVDVFKHVEKRQLDAERKGVNEVDGIDLATSSKNHKNNQNRIEDDPFWREQLPKIDYIKAKARNPGDVVREIFGTAWQAGQDPDRIEVTVGKSGVRHLDLAQVWTPKEGWQFSDEADHRALDEVHWKSIDKGGRKAQAAELAASNRRYEALMLFIGIKKGDSDEKITEMAERAYDYFDDDNSGELNMEELDDAFRKMGIELTTSELKDLVEEVDADGNGLIDKGEFCDMVLTTIRRMKEEDTQKAMVADLDIFEQEDVYRKKLVKQRNKMLKEAGRDATNSLKGSRGPQTPKSPGDASTPGSIASPSFLDSLGPATPGTLDGAANNDSTGWLNRTEGSFSARQAHEHAAASATEAELAAVRHKMQFRPGAFSGMGISNGIPPKSSGGKSQEAQERTLPTPSTGVELEDLLRERERRIREREGGKRVTSQDLASVRPKEIPAGRSYRTYEETMEFVDERKRLATKRTTQQLEKNIFESDLPEVEL